MISNNILKLWKAMLQLAEIETDKAMLIVESDLAEGVEVFVENEDGYVPAPDGEYVAEDKVIVVAEGKVAEIRIKEEEQPEEPAQEPEPVQEPAAEQEPDERDARIAELQAKQDELEAMLAEKDARIAELEAMLVQREEEMKMSADIPAKEKVKNNTKSGALRYFN